MFFFRSFINCEVLDSLRKFRISEDLCSLKNPLQEKQNKLQSDLGLRMRYLDPLITLVRLRSSSALAARNENPRGYEILTKMCFKQISKKRKIVHTTEMVPEHSIRWNEVEQIFDSISEYTISQPSLDPTSDADSQEEFHISLEELDELKQRLFLVTENASEQKSQEFLG